MILLAPVSNIGVGGAPFSPQHFPRLAISNLLGYRTLGFWPVPAHISFTPSEGLLCLTQLVEYPSQTYIQPWLHLHLFIYPSVPFTTTVFSAPSIYNINIVGTDPTLHR